MAGWCVAAALYALGTIGFASSLATEEGARRVSLGHLIAAATWPALASAATALSLYHIATRYIRSIR
jgi:hypothetical protein